MPATVEKNDTTAPGPKPNAAPAATLKSIPGSIRTTAATKTRVKAT